MLIQDKIYIKKENESLDFDAIKKVCTYTNPEYFSKMNLGLSVYNVPKVIRSYAEDDQWFTILRGEAIKIKPYIQHLNYEFQHADHPINLQYINNDFELDEYQEAAVEAIKSKRQGVVHAVTSAGKSLIILKAIVELKQKALIVVHRKVLMQQLLEDINKYIRNEKGEKIQVGIIGNGVFKFGDITIGIDKSIAKNIKACRNEFGTVILDECHLAPAITILSLINSLNSKFRFGFSGTLKRKDGKEFLIFATFGEIIARISKEVLLEKGRVVPVKIKIIETDTQFDFDSVSEAIGDTKARHLQEKTIHSDPQRLLQAAEIAYQRSQAGEKTIILSRYVQPCYDLQILLKEKYGIEAGVITGKNTKEALASYDAMKHSDMKIICATVGCVSTGVSISDLDNIVLISPIYTNELLLHQIRGRLMRMFEGKKFGTLYFLYDQYIFPGWKLKRFLTIMNA